jgi:hypothetical protein
MPRHPSGNAKTVGERVAAYRARQREAGKKLVYVDGDRYDNSGDRVAELEEELSRYRNGDIARRLEPIIEGLFVEGTKHRTTMSPDRVAQLTHDLEQVLVHSGIIRESERVTARVKYARQTEASKRTVPLDDTKRPRNRSKSDPLLKFLYPTVVRPKNR